MRRENAATHAGSQPARERRSLLAAQPRTPRLLLSSRCSDKIRSSSSPEAAVLYTHETCGFPQGQLEVAKVMLRAVAEAMVAVIMGTVMAAAIMMVTMVGE